MKSKTILSVILIAVVATMSGCDYLGPLFFQSPLVVAGNNETMDATNGDITAAEYQGSEFVTDGENWFSFSGAINASDDIDYFAFDISGDTLIEVKVFYNATATSPGNVLPDDGYTYENWNNQDAAFPATLIEAYRGPNDETVAETAIEHKNVILGVETDEPNDSFGKRWLLKVEANEQYSTGRYLVLIR